jgi:predicted metal-dependent peptidase
MPDIKRELIRGVVDLTRSKEFYGHVVQQFQKVYLKGDEKLAAAIPTAAVGRVPGDRFVKLYLNLDYFGTIYAKHGEKKGWEYVLGALEHETLHIIFDHLFLKFDDRIRGGVAVDCVVNPLISKDRLMEDWVHPAKYGLPEGKSAVWYYHELAKNKEFQSQLKAGAFGPGGLMEWLKGSHVMWEDLDGDDLTEEFVKDVIRKAKEMCDGNYGDVPGSVLDSIEELLKRRPPKIPWSRVLRMFCASSIESVLDYTMKRVSRRFDTRPGTVHGDVLDLAVIVDTSGSISDWQLASFFSEIDWISRNGAIVTVYEADAKFQRSYRYAGRFDGKVHGRGGTCLDPALEEAEKKRHDAAIYFTDFEAPPLKRRYKLPVLWLLTKEMEKKDMPCDWGRVIVLDVPPVPA